MARSTSFSQQAWKRLKRNKGAMAGMIVIGLTLFAGIFAYFLSPDHTPYANGMVLEISGQKPGFSIQMLSLEKRQPVARRGWFHYLIYGQESNVTLVPVKRWQFKGDSIRVEKYVDEETTLAETYALSEVVSASASAKDAQFLVEHEHLRTHHYWLGTDKFGRDILSRLLVGTRVSLSVGCIAVLISLTIGIFLGAIAGYFRGAVDEAVMWLINVIWSVPTLLLVFAISLALGKGFWQVFIAVGLTMWVSVARIIRGQVLGLRELQFVEATRALGYGHVRTIVKHILPNIMGPVMVVAASNFATAIVIEAGLSFLGVGVQPPQPSWGLMIKENYNFIITHNPLLALAPGIAIMLLVLAFNLLGNGLRDAMDIKGKI
ncbi:ABC transporter permease subunit [Chitinophaga sp. SYP-B3965]|uniref:ABC transporter permease n=1 Tax=Chitinophaga sp. SYP-B3965 TaxID=2663120 RepID=UPI001299FC45|nr:ABC transporter permease [Chitinophaga sp. SYP-B3965]MRG46845.1 ABC transporter permease subunit [Chitinophaga sp. SYP-B3965]